MQNLKLYNALLDEMGKRMAQACGMEIKTAKRLIETIGLNLNHERLMEIVTIVDNFMDDPDKEEKVRVLEIQNHELKEACEKAVGFLQFDQPNGKGSVSDVIAKLYRAISGVAENRHQELPKCEHGPFELTGLATKVCMKCKCIFPRSP